MTKEQFDLYKGKLHCKTCGKDVPKVHIEYRKVYKNGNIARCNVCEWIKRHNGIPKINGFTTEEIKIVLYDILYNDSCCLNDVADKIGKSINDIISLISELKIKGKKCYIKCNCECCGKEISVFPSVYQKNQNLYCSNTCYWKDKPNKMDKGEGSKYYKRVSTYCTNCGKEIKITPHNYKLKNSYGESHNFCCQRCYWDYRSKYYIGEKSSMYNYQFTDEQREAMRIHALENSRKSNRFNTGIQLIIDNILIKNNIQYEREYIIKYYAVDNYLTKSRLIIEVMGDYWHASPLKYNKGKYNINEIQKKVIIKDKQKYSYILNHLNINILYLWESDINQNPTLCEKLILKYIESNGELENYHSFNWKNDDGILQLNNEIIKPYQSMQLSEYKDLITEII